MDENTRVSFGDIYSLSPSSPVQKKDSEDNLEQMKRSFDLLGHMKQRNGACREISCGFMFKECEICGHHDDLVYYAKDNTFFCFGANGNKGGSIIDYIMHSEKVELSTAIARLYELSGIEHPMLSPSQKNRTRRLTIQILESFLDSIGVNLRYNALTHEVEIKGFDKEYSPEQIESILTTLIFNRIGSRYSSSSMTVIQHYLQTIFAKNHYYPMLDMLNTTVWDKQSRLYPKLDPQVKMWYT